MAFFENVIRYILLESSFWLMFVFSVSLSLVFIRNLDTIEANNGNGVNRKGWKNNGSFVVNPSKRKDSFCSKLGYNGERLKNIFPQKSKRESRNNQASGVVFVKKSLTIPDTKFSRAYYLNMQHNPLFLPTYNWESQVYFAQFVFQTR